MSELGRRFKQCQSLSEAAALATQSMKGTMLGKAFKDFLALPEEQRGDLNKPGALIAVVMDVLSKSTYLDATRVVLCLVAFYLNSISLSEKFERSMNDEEP